MLNLEEIRALESSCNQTWGRTSETGKMTHRLAGDILELQMMSVVQFAAEAPLRLQVDNQRVIANDIFASALKTIKDDFSDKVDRALVVKEISRDDDVELISATSNSPRKIAYYRCLLKLQVS